MASTTSRGAGIAVVRDRNTRVFNDREYDRLSEYQADDFVQHGPFSDTEIRGNEESLALMQEFHAGFSDLEATEELSFTDGTYVCSRYQFEGTHDGEFKGIAPTQSRVSVEGNIINRIDDGKIAESWASVDMLGLFEQLGAVPPVDEIAS
ncbi:MAG: ester cyclase [Halobacteriaceae archaeon]